jgi:hypothetical protein
MRKSVLFALLSIITLAFAGRHSPAEIFNGAYYFVNSSQIINGVPVSTGGGKVGNIMYIPAYPGALFGNMSVVYGLVYDSSATCTQALTGFSAYTGGYQVFPELGYVAHYPFIVSNPISGHTPNNLPAIRYYQSYDDDNLISVESRPDESFLFWGRDFPFPTGPSCTLTVAVSATGNSWVENGVSHQQYTLTVTNIGDSTVTAAQVIINLGASASISSSWNLQQVQGNQYSVSLFGGLAAGQSSNSAGFIVAGAGTVTAGVPPSNVVCN